MTGAMGQTNGFLKEPQRLSLSDIDFWKRRLGLFPVPLRGEATSDQSPISVLLNGTRGNFCLDLTNQGVDENTRSIAWSTNVGHYIALSKNAVEVQRWDERAASLERFTLKSIYENIEGFHAYLEKNAPRQDISVIAHAIHSFRSLRATLYAEDGTNSLRAFLYLLACAADGTPQLSQSQLSQWRLAPESTDSVNHIEPSDWDALYEGMVKGRRGEKLVPDFALTLRHASGHLFQEAGYEAIRKGQPTLPGFLPSPVSIGSESTGRGLHFTPPALVRALVEQTLYNANSELSTSPSITVFDPACGSGEFLREVLRQLRLRHFRGHVRLIGWDIFEPARDMANFVLGWETRADANVDINIRTVNSLREAKDWPNDVDIVLMNPPFISWPAMDSEQKEYVKEILGDLRKYSPDVSHAFMLKAASCLRKGGVVGSILPASFLNTDSASKLRGRLSEELSPRIIAKLGSHSLFRDALVDAAFYVGAKETGTSQPTIAFWCDHRLSSSNKGFRVLRRLRNHGDQVSLPVDRERQEGFCIYQAPLLGRSAMSWSPSPYRAWKRHESLLDLPRVKKLFDVIRGVITGKDEVFILAKSKWMELQDTEKEYFRPVIRGKSIRYGCLVDSEYVFYPFGDKSINTEEQLKDVVPTYYTRYLEPLLPGFKTRKYAKPDKWWELDRPRDWELNQNPKIASKQFGNAALPFIC
ncbi:MAG: N-6 DNA methylase [Armatimonadota bacterium]|nr:N-6 DNA methylase [Armatimonadota bacterium]